VSLAPSYADAARLQIAAATQAAEEVDAVDISAPQIAPSFPFHFPQSPYSGAATSMPFASFPMMGIPQASMRGMHPMADFSQAMGMGSMGFPSPHLAPMPMWDSLSVRFEDAGLMHTHTQVHTNSHSTHTDMRKCAYMH